MDRSIAKTAKSYMQLPFRRAVLRGLGVVLPPLLTVVILGWIFTTIQSYVLVPVETAAQRVVTWMIDETLTQVPEEAELLGPEANPDQRFRWDDQEFVAIRSDQWIPLRVYERVKQNPGLEPPETSQSYYHRYVELIYLKRFVVVPLFLLVFILLLYLLGRFLAYGMGRMMYNAMEAIITRLPIIRTVYTSVKQVTDFVFSESEMEFTRVVAVEYPRKGIWSLAFVTGEGMREVSEAAGEPILTVLIPTSPMPATGFTVTVLRSETVDLDLTVDQAFQFIVSCGVVVPMAQQHHKVTGQVQSAISQHLEPSTSLGGTPIPK